MAVHTDLTLDPGSLVRWALESLVCGCFLLLYISNKALIAPDLCQVWCLGAGEAVVVNSLSPHRIYTLVVKSINLSNRGPRKP